MDKSKIILAALASGPSRSYSPVQVQKLVFLIEKRVAKIGGPVFDFVPYAYGPFDADVYGTLEALSDRGLVEIVREPGLRWRKFRLTESGRTQGESALKSLGSDAADHVKRLNEFVSRLSFAQLVGAIYKAYPEMRVNSVFRE